MFGIEVWQKWFSPLALLSFLLQMYGMFSENVYDFYDFLLK